ncbi:MAG: ankyrin repeat domain-containing protein [Alphaproteobacteria bacterium]
MSLFREFFNGLANAVPVTPARRLLAELQHSDSDQAKCLRLASLCIAPDVRDEYGDTPLIHAATNGFKDVVDKLMAKGANVNAKGLLRRTALNVAAEGGHNDIVEALLKNGADVNAEMGGPFGGSTPLTSALVRDNKALVDLLLKNGADPDKQPHIAGTPLNYACAQQNLDTVTLLIKAGAKTCAAGDFLPDTPIQAAIGSRKMPAGYAHRPVQLKIIGMLLDAGADVNEQSLRVKDTALITASASGQHDIAELLLSRGADIEKQSGTSGVTPLIAAACRGDTAMVEYLLLKGAKIDGKDNDGMTALFHASASQHTATVAALYAAGARFDADMAQAAALMQQPGHGISGQALERMKEYRAILEPKKPVPAAPKGP